MLLIHLRSFYYKLKKIMAPMLSSMNKFLFKSFRNSQLLTLICVNAFFASQAKGEPTVPGTTTSLYAVVRDPGWFDVADDGTIYTGRDATGSGGGSGDAVAIHRISQGGSPVEEFGGSIPDPDAVVIDRKGTVVNPGMVLVGGDVGNNQGAIWSFLQDGTPIKVLGPDGRIGNVGKMLLDSKGAVIFMNTSSKEVMEITRVIGAVLGVKSVFAYGANFDSQTMTITTDDTLILLNGSGDLLRYYARNGELLKEVPTNLKQYAALAFGRGDFWGDKLYSIDKENNLVTVDADGKTTVVGQNFTGSTDIMFTVSGQLLVSSFSEDCFWQIDPSLKVSIRIGSMEIKWNSVSGAKYKVQYKTSVQGATWVDLVSEPIIGNGSLISIQDDVGDVRHKLYQVIKIP